MKVPELRRRVLIQATACFLVVFDNAGRWNTENEMGLGTLRGTGREETWNVEALVLSVQFRDIVLIVP